MVTVSSLCGRTLNIPDTNGLRVRVEGIKGRGSQRVAFSAFFFCPRRRNEHGRSAANPAGKS